MLIVLVYLLLFFPFTFFFSILRETFAWEQVNGWYFVGVSYLLYTAFSVPIVPAGKRAALLFLGKPIRNLGSGPAVVPFLVFSKVEFSSEAIQFEIPHDPKIRERYRSKNHQDKESVALRIPTGSPESAMFLALPMPDLLTPSEEEAWKEQGKTKEKRFDKAKASVEKDPADPLHVRYTLEPVGIVRFSIEDPMSFVENVGDADKAKIQMAEVFAATIQEEFRHLTPALITALLHDLNESVQLQLEFLTGEKKRRDRPSEKPWGVNTEFAKISSVGFTETVNRALADRADLVTRAVTAKDVAKKAKDTKILEGQGLGGYDKARLTGLGEGEQALLKKRAAGLQKLTEMAESDAGKLVVQLDAMQRTVSPTSQVFLAGPDLTTAVMGSVLAGRAPFVPRQLPPPAPPAEKTEGSSSEEKKE